jgi:hypothetical protein
MVSKERIKMLEAFYDHLATLDRFTLDQAELTAMRLGLLDDYKPSTLVEQATRARLAKRIRSRKDEHGDNVYVSIPTGKRSRMYAARAHLRQKELARHVNDCAKQQSKYKQKKEVALAEYNKKYGQLSLDELNGSEAK